MRKHNFATRFLTAACMMLMVGMQASAQKIEISKARFHLGDDPSWKNVQVDDSKWKEIDVTRTWDTQGYKLNASYAWYRVHVNIPKSLLDKSDLKETVLFDMAKIDDTDEVYLNGTMIGKTGRMPSDDKGYASAWSKERKYSVSAKKGLVKWDQDNVIAVRVYSGGEPGGMFSAPIKIGVLSRVDALQINHVEAKKGVCEVHVHNTATAALSGKLSVEVVDFETGKTISTLSKKVTSNPKKDAVLAVPFDQSRQLLITSTFTESKSQGTVTSKYSPRYILTPAAPKAPRFNVPGLWGVRPGSPVIYRFPVSGVRPMKFTVEGMPEGIKLDAELGVLSGSVKKIGNYHMKVTAQNAEGTATQEFTLRVGDNSMALTPPMGWNSWNCWGLSVSQEKVISSAKALLDKGLADYGYSYMNIDDGWEAPERNADGTIKVNEKFPDMKGLGDWLHSQGLKFGIYSSPGSHTCGGYLGSLDHEKQDAESYNAWGIDYLKYDWCFYGRKHEKERDNQTRASYVRPYLLMEGFLRDQPRDIFYSLCQYGMNDVWEWGHAVDANSWRTTGDITDTWESMYDLGFVRNEPLYPWAGPGHWNDPDMLIVGKVGWSANLRDSRLTPDEQYTHISLWSLMASDMLIGCDISQMDDFTVGLLCNHEVNMINQDVLGKQGHRALTDGDLQIWMRHLSDGTVAVGVFNVGLSEIAVDLSKMTVEFEGKTYRLGQLALRDLWRQKDMTAEQYKFRVPSHGCRLFKAK